MVDVKEATFVPDRAGGGEVQAVLAVGNQEIKSTLPLGQEDAFLQSLLDDLAVRIEKVTFIPGPGRREVQVTMTMAGRAYISHLPFEADDELIASSMDRLLQAVGARFVRTMTTSLGQADAGASEGAASPAAEAT